MNMLVLIGGGSCSGKRTLAERIVERLGEDQALRICLDSFYMPIHRCVAEDVNFDHPSALDWPLVRSCVRNLIGGESCDIPRYNYVSGLRDGHTLAHARPLVILHGLWALRDRELSSMADVKLYMDVPADVRLVRRIRRDVIGSERGWDIGTALNYYLRYTRPMYEMFVKPSISAATAILDGSGDGEDNTEDALHLIREASGTSGTSGQAVRRANDGSD